MMDALARFKSGEIKPVFAQVTAQSGTLTIVGTPTVTLRDDSGLIVSGYDHINLTGSDIGALAAPRAWYLVNTTDWPAGAYSLQFRIVALGSDGLSRTYEPVISIEIESVGSGDVSPPLSPSDQATVAALVLAQLQRGVFSVTDYGATGDGATNDTAAIQAAIDAASAVRGVVLFPPPPVRYRITAQLNVATAGVSILGMAPASRAVPIIQQSTYGAPIFYVTASRVSIRDLSGEYGPTTTVVGQHSAGVSSVGIASEAGIVSGDSIILGSYPNQEVVVATGILEAGPFRYIQTAAQTTLAHASGSEVRCQAVVNGSVDGKPARDAAAFAVFVNGDECSVVDCAVNAMVTGVKFRGGTASAATNTYRNRVSGLDTAWCNFGLLAEQQTGFAVERLGLTDLVFSQDGHTAPAGSAPGHAIYMTGVAGSSASYDVTIRDVYCDAKNAGSGCSAVKVKFTSGAVISNIVAEHCERGLDLERCNYAVVSDVTVVAMLACPNDSQQAAVNMLNCIGTLLTASMLRCLTDAGVGVDCPAVVNRLDTIGLGIDVAVTNVGAITNYSAGFGEQAFRIQGTPRTIVQDCRHTDLGSANKYSFGFIENTTLVVYPDYSVLRRPTVIGTTKVHTVAVATTGMVLDIDGSLTPITSPAAGEVAVGSLLRLGAAQSGNAYVLPDPATCPGLSIEAQATNAGGLYTYTFTAATGNVQGASSYTLTSDHMYARARFLSDGSAWWVS